MVSVKTAAAILRASDGRFLLQLRDNNPDIPFQNHWTNFGGVIKSGETPEQCIRRELQEELGFNAEEVRLWKILQWENYLVHIFEVPIDRKIDELSLGEGADMRFFTMGEILEIKLAFCFSAVYLDYFDERAEKRGFSAILKDRDGRILLQRRDDIPSIPYPGQWSAFGGAFEPGERPEDGTKRELMEELEFKPAHYRLWKVKVVFGYLDYIFEVDLDEDISSLHQHEGMDMGFFSEQEILKMKLAFDLTPVFEEYFKDSF